MLDYANTPESYRTNNYAVNNTMNDNLRASKTGHQSPQMVTLKEKRPHLDRHTYAHTLWNTLRQ